MRSFGPAPGVVDAIVPASLQARQDLFEAGKEPWPTGLGAAVGLLLVRPETCLLHAQMGARAGRRERPSDDALQAISSPGVGQRLVRLDRSDAAIDGPPIGAELKVMADNGDKIVLHQPLLDQVRLGQRAPDLFRRMRDLTLDDDGAKFGRISSVAHWSILLRRFSRSSNRFSQKPVIWLVQSISGASAPSCAL